jgi:hypothetical protein
MLTQHFYIENRSLGSCQRYPLTNRGTRPISYAFFCPVCAEVWARAVIFDTQFFCFHKPCRKHHVDAGGIPGSLWMPMEPEFTSSLDGEVLKREFLLHLDYLENKLCQM